MAKSHHDGHADPLTAFCEFLSSPNWLYPTARFFGHTLYGNKFSSYYIIHVLYLEYYYDIDFMPQCAGQEVMQTRNKVLYESYRDMV